MTRVPARVPRLAPFCLLAMLVAALASGPASAAERSVTLEGVVLQARKVPELWTRGDLAAVQRKWPRRPVAGAIVTVSNAHGKELQAVTDAQGRFRLGPIALAGAERDAIDATGPRHFGLHVSGFGADLRAGTNEIVIRLPRVKEGSFCPGPATR